MRISIESDKEITELHIKFSSEDSSSKCDMSVNRSSHSYADNNTSYEMPKSSILERRANKVKEMQSKLNNNNSLDEMEDEEVDEPVISLDENRVSSSMTGIKV